MINGINPAEPFPNPSTLEASLYPASSRYYGLKILKYTRPDGREVAYLQRRIIPDGSELQEFRLHTVNADERLDLIANDYLGDPEQFWRICDANNAIVPAELEQVGDVIRITYPEGFSGGTDA